MTGARNRRAEHNRARSMRPQGPKALVMLSRHFQPSAETTARLLPAVRRDCESGERPCPFVSCRHHLALDITRGGSIKMNFPGRELGELVDTCTLDTAERGPLSLQGIAQRMNLTREAVRLIAAKALLKLQRRELEVA